jgi:hypothetical protein
MTPREQLLLEKLRRYIEVGEWINRELEELGHGRLIYTVPDQRKPSVIEAGVGYQPRARALKAALTHAIERRETNAA